MSRYLTHPSVRLMGDGSATVAGSMTGEGWSVLNLARGWVGIHNAVKVDLTDEDAVDRLELRVFDSRDEVIAWLLGDCEVAS